MQVKDALNVLDFQYNSGIAQLITQSFQGNAIAMLVRFCLLFTISILGATPNLHAQVAGNNAEEFEIEPGFASLFNGEDLTGWNILATTEEQKQRLERRKKNNLNAPKWSVFDETIDLAGRTKSPDGRFVAENGRLVVTVPEEGRRIQAMFTQREFEQDFTLKLEFRAATNADSGVFIKGKQLQCRDFPNAGPYKELKKFKPGDWNELVIVTKGETAYCTCNGEVLESELKIPAKGPIGVEGDQGKLEYRRIRIGPATDRKNTSDRVLNRTDQ